MGHRSLRFWFGCAVLAQAAIAAVAACGSSDDATNAFGPSTSQDGGRSDGSSTNDGGFPSEDAGVSIVPANGIVIVHAASFGAFRLCFESEGARRPIPSADLLPDSNLLGVDVGSVVRIDPLATAPGKTYAFAVDDIKSFYPPGKSGPTCDDLLKGAGFQLAHDVGTITKSLATGVHLLVLRGSLAGQDLRLEQITLDAFTRPPQTLPVQLLPLSPNLPARTGNRKLGLAAGTLPDAIDGGDASPPAPFLEGSFALGKAVPNMPVALDFDPNEEGVYATSGFMLTLGGFADAGADAGDAGPPEIILAQSLADIQRLSAPRALPAAWFSAGSSYVLLVLGDAQEKDAAASDLAQLHFVAIPLAARPTADASVEDASTD